MLLVYGHYIFYSISVRTDFRCQILMAEDAPRTKRVNGRLRFVSGSLYQPHQWLISERLSWQIKGGIWVSILAPPVADLREVVMAD